MTNAGRGISVAGGVFTPKKKAAPAPTSLADDGAAPGGRKSARKPLSARLTKSATRALTTLQKLRDMVARSTPESNEKVTLLRNLLEDGVPLIEGVNNAISELVSDGYAFKAGRAAKPEVVLAVGTDVVLTKKKHDMYVQIFSTDQLASLKIAKVLADGKGVQLMAADGTNIGIFKNGDVRAVA